MKKTVSSLLFLLLFTSLQTVIYSLSLQGAGATFPYPLYIKMFDEYHQKTQTQVNYQAIGSGGGIRQLKAKTVDFGATDAFVTDKNLSKHFDQSVLHIPICLGAVALTFNLPGIETLNLSADLISDIFQGNIRFWNDKRIQELNPEHKIPKLSITPVFRADASGTTSIFTDYLSKTSESWNSVYGKGKTIASRVGLSGKGNAGVAGLVQKIKGSVGYVGSVYAIQNKMPSVFVKNKSGNFIKPSVESISQSSATNIPSDSRTSITDTESNNGYPISGLTWIIVYENQRYDEKTKEEYQSLKKLLTWMVTDGQDYTHELHYAPLPDSLKTIATSIINQMNY